MAADFTTVAKVTELPPGGRLVVQLGRRWVVIFHANGRYYALDDMCSHEEVPLSDGRIIAGAIIECHEHGAQFDLDTGEVLAPPALTGVRAYHVRVVGDELQIARK